jgi:hypothetical protein
VDRCVFRELLSAGYGLLPGKLTGSGVFMAVSGGSCQNERRKNLYGAHDPVCSGSSNLIGDRRSGAKPWTCR